MPDPEPAATVEIVDALPGFVTIFRRSPTLDGSVPLRAAQGCRPFLDGNAAGLHLRLGAPALLRRRRGETTLILTDEAHRIAYGDHPACVDRLAERGLIERGGAWHRELGRAIAWPHRGVLHLWTGLLVRPAPGTWLLVTGARNRRCQVEVVEQVIPDDGGFVPLVLGLDLGSLRRAETWLDAELACLQPLRPGVDFTLDELDDRPELGRAWADYYDPRYLEGRARGAYQGRYHKVTAREPDAADRGPAASTLVRLGGPGHRIATFDRFATPRGRTRRHPARDRLRFAVVRNVWPVAGRWDGVAARDLDVRFAPGAHAWIDAWAERYGADSRGSVEWVGAYAAYGGGGNLGEPLLAVMPWVLTATPPGWSSVIDTAHLPNLEGHRGVVSTDRYFGVPPSWQFDGPGRFAIPRGTPIARVLPVPRQLLEPDYRLVPVG